MPAAKISKKFKKLKGPRKLIISLLIIIVPGGIAIYFYFFNVGHKYLLNSSNTRSVVSDQYHKVGVPNDWTYKSGEWTPNTFETYSTLVDFNIPELAAVGSATLHLNIESFNNKTIQGQRCPQAKKFSVKKLLYSWNHETARFSDIESLQKSGEVVAYFTVNPNDSFVEVEVPVSEIVAAQGFTIDQADEVLCRVSFYSHLDRNGEARQPYFVTKSGFSFSIN